MNIAGNMLFAVFGGFAIVSDEHSQSMLHLDRSVVPRRVRVIQGCLASLIAPPAAFRAAGGSFFEEALALMIWFLDF